MIATLSWRNTPVGYPDPVSDVTVHGHGQCVSRSASRGVTMTTAIYAVEEMVRRSWKAAVSQGVRPVFGVAEAAVNLVAGGRSPLMVLRGTRLGAGAGHDAVGNACFDLTADGAPVVGSCGDGPSTRHGDTQPDRERSEPSKEGVGRDRHGLPSCGNRSRSSRIEVIPDRYRARALPEHRCAGPLRVHAAAGHRPGRPTATFEANAVRKEAKLALSWAWVPGTLFGRWT